MNTGGWDVVIEKVERELGKVHLACPFGSQRYNCDQPGSDNDIFLVYQAKTRDILSLDPPKQTIKNSETAIVDYTVLEIQRYCELLVSGDPRCVETLCLDEESVLAKASPEWKQLKSVREMLLTRSCFDKYMKEAQGTTGLKRLHKWQAENGEREELTAKQNKLAYIVLRLLQNARDLAVEQRLNVYKSVDSSARHELMAVRQGKYTFTSLMSLMDKYLQEIESLTATIKPDTSEGKSHIQDWLLDMRIKDLQVDGIQ